MQNASDADLAIAVDNATRETACAVFIDWNRDRNFGGAYEEVTNVVLSVNMTSDYLGDLPQESTLVEGYAATRMDITLGGNFTDGKSIVDLLTPYRTDSPFYGLSLMGIDVYVSMMVRKPDGGAPTCVQFRGLTTLVDVDHESRTVQISAIDYADRVRANISFPVWANSTSDGQIDPDGDNSYGMKLNSQWIIDHILRKNGIYASPNPPYVNGLDKTIINVTGHGGLLCDRSIEQNSFGAEYDSYLTVPDDGYVTTSRFGTMLACSPYTYSVPGVSATLLQKPTMVSGDIYAIQLQAKFGTNNVFYDDPTFNNGRLFQMFNTQGLGGSYIDINITQDGHVTLAVVNLDAPQFETFSFGPVTTYGWHDIAVAVVFNGASSEVWVRLDEGTTGVFSVNLSAFGPDDGLYQGGWSAEAAVPISNLHVASLDSSSEIFDAWYEPSTFVPAAHIDAGLNWLTGLPIRQDVESWELLKEVVGAEFGTHGFDVNGEYYFYNRNTSIVARLTADKIIDPSINLGSMKISFRSESVKNQVSLKSAPRLLDNRQSFIYEHASATLFESNPGVNVFYVTLAEPAYHGGTGPWGNETAANFGDDDFITTRFVCIDPFTNTEVPVNSVALMIHMDDFHQRRLKLVVTNNSGTAIRFSDTAGRPTLKIAGVQLSSPSEFSYVATNFNSMGKYGQRVLELSGSEFQQTQRPFADILRMVLDDLKEPLPVIEDAVLELGDPRVELADVVSMTDQRIGGELLAMISGIDREYSREGGIRDVYRLRVFGQPARWILGHSVYSVLATTTIPG